MVPDDALRVQDILGSEARPSDSSLAISPGRQIMARAFHTRRLVKLRMVGWENHGIVAAICRYDPNVWCTSIPLSMWWPLTLQTLILQHFDTYHIPKLCNLVVERPNTKHFADLTFHSTWRPGFHEFPTSGMVSSWFIASRSGFIDSYNTKICMEVFQVRLGLTNDGDRKMPT